MGILEVDCQDQIVEDFEIFCRLLKSFEESKFNKITSFHLVIKSDIDSLNQVHLICVISLFLSLFLLFIYQIISRR